MSEKKQFASEVLASFLMADYEKFIKLHMPSDATLLHSKEEWNKYLTNGNKKIPFKLLTIDYLKIIVALQALTIILLLCK